MSRQRLFRKLIYSIGKMPWFYKIMVVSNFSYRCYFWPVNYIQSCFYDQFYIFLITLQQSKTRWRRWNFMEYLRMLKLSIQIWLESIKPRLSGSYLGASRFQIVRIGSCHWSWVDDCRHQRTCDSVAGEAVLGCRRGPQGK